MKAVFYVLALIVLGCKDRAKRKEIASYNDTINQPAITKKQDQLKHYTTKDTILITTDLGDTLKYSKKEFNTIIDKHPEFIDTYIKDPDQDYACNYDNDAFGSELGQDAYFTVYAYFLKQKNGLTEYAHRRAKLINIYANVNSLFQQLEHGGTFFGHQYSRIPAYAEYYIYVYKQRGNVYSETYDIRKQKELYIKSLRQLIEDKSKIDFEVLGSEKIKHYQELNKTLDKINKAITDIFYLRSAQEFHYWYYSNY